MDSQNGQDSSEKSWTISSFLVFGLTLNSVMTWQNWLSHYISFLFFSFLLTYNYKMEHGKVSHDFVTISQWCDGWSQIVLSQVTVTVCHMTRAT